MVKLRRAPGDRGGFRSLSPPARLLVVHFSGINAGFYLVLPFLAVHMGDLGFGARRWSGWCWGCAR